jgi:ABC-type lipoprotein release transport system permease subunit
VGQLLSALLFGIAPTDVAPIAAASTFLLVVALVASFGPAWRATRINPVDTLRVA